MWWWYFDALSHSSFLLCQWDKAGISDIGTTEQKAKPRVEALLYENDLKWDIATLKDIYYMSNDSRYKA